MNVHDVLVGMFLGATLALWGVAARRRRPHVDPPLPMPDPPYPKGKR